MELDKTLRAVGLKYDIDDAEVLDGGSFPASQMDILMGLLDYWWANRTDENLKVYLEAKAQFILANSRKRPLVHVL